MFTWEAEQHDNSYKAKRKEYFSVMHELFQFNGVSHPSFVHNVKSGTVGFWLSLGKRLYLWNATTKLDKINVILELGLNYIRYYKHDVIVLFFPTVRGAILLHHFFVVTLYNTVCPCILAVPRCKNVSFFLSVIICLITSNWSRQKQIDLPFSQILKYFILCLFYTVSDREWIGTTHEEVCPVHARSQQKWYQSRTLTHEVKSVTSAHARKYIFLSRSRRDHAWVTTHAELTANFWASNSKSARTHHSPRCNEYHVQDPTEMPFIQENSPKMPINRKNSSQILQNLLTSAFIGKFQPGNYDHGLCNSTESSVTKLDSAKLVLPEGLTPLNTLSIGIHSKMHVENRGFDAIASPWYIEVTHQQEDVIFLDRMKAIWCVVPRLHFSVDLAEVSLSVYIRSVLLDLGPKPVNWGKKSISVI